MLSGQVWASCEVENPGFCESKLSLNEATSTAYEATFTAYEAASTAYAAKWALAWVALAIVLSTFNLSL